ncbi:MAG: helix-turn-helix domain-containing protein [Anaerolineae bacterium]|nr:helix-turn-helix domain-containing protein [Anaerolineae bacterium]
MNQKPEMTAAEIEQLLAKMSANNTLDAALTDDDIELLLTHTQSENRAAQLAPQAVLKMQAAQRKREQRLPTFGLGQYLANARLATGLTVSQVAEEASISISELETLENGIWSIDQIIQKFPSKLMVRILATIQLAIQDFSDELVEFANKASLKANQSAAYARSHQSLNTNARSLIEAVAEYTNELHRLSS